MSKKKSQDPFAKREASKYPDPIVSREFILQFLKDRGSPATFEELSDASHIENNNQLEALRRRLLAMQRDGQLIRNRRGSYGLVDKMSLLSGNVIGHPEGYGFVRIDKTGEDYFLSANQMRKVFHGDRVLVRPMILYAYRGKLEAEIVEILERGTLEVVGRLQNEEGYFFVIPENKRICHEIVIAKNHLASAVAGDMVVVTVITQPSNRAKPTGHVKEILGQHMAPGMEIEVAIRSYQLPHVWSPEVLAESAGFSEKVAPADIKGMKDLRALPFVTIDGEDARDFDDAVYGIARPKGGWQLWVAIAHVSHYVKQDSALDQAAYQRGTSVYFPEQVIPMLPEVLSNGLCSLNPHVDRLCLVCEMLLSEDGRITRSRFYEAVIHSHARLTYTEVAKMQYDEPAAPYTALWPQIKNLYAIYQALRKHREIRGALDFEMPETKILFERSRKIEQIIAVERNDAHRLIEECMLAANVAAAKLIAKSGLPSLFRVHNKPTVEKIANLREFLKEFGLTLHGGKNPRPLDFAQVLKSIETRADGYMIQTVLLRSLTQAVYQPEYSEHFGLAYPVYTQFTSPIRRYPDLIVHRTIKHILDKQAAETFSYSTQQMQMIGEHCSMTERRADDATRDVIGWLKCEYIQDRLGESFDGVISGVTGFGIFVMLSKVFVEGLVHITALKNDYYRFDAIKHCLQGEKLGRSYRLGDKIKVKIARVDLDERKIDFILA